MCGIMGWCGNSGALKEVLNGLQKLEYRGYDSCGVALLNDKIVIEKTSGRISALRNLTKDFPKDFTTAIGHTRWATHGAPTKNNAHPFISPSGTFAIVHNGIIENYITIAEKLKSEGAVFSSDTDSEVIAFLLERNYEGDMLSAIRKTAQSLEGWFAVAIVSPLQPNKIFAVKNRSPLIVGYGEGFSALASDAVALTDCKGGAYALNDGEIAEIDSTSVSLYDKNLRRIKNPALFLPKLENDGKLCGYDCFMLKEIHSQPDKIRLLLSNLASDEQIKSFIKRIIKSGISKIDIIGCGSAYYASLSGAYAIERLTGIPVFVKNAGEYRYSHPITSQKTLTVAVSQSGETADTVEATRLAINKGSPVLAIVNSLYSTLSRTANCVLYQSAGTEIAVATTKGYTTQAVALYYLAVIIREALSLNSSAEFNSALLSSPEIVNGSIMLGEQIEDLSSRIYQKSHVFFIGRGADYCASLEGALKLKEISYLHAEAYASSELKHGTISLITDGVPVIAVDTNPQLSSKNIGSIREITARGGVVYALSSHPTDALYKECRSVIKLPASHELISPLASVPAMQLLAYHVAKRLGRDVDKPRNLAKSVTVE